MSRPAKITNDQILDAARRVFLESGYGAPTSEVAREAGVSEGTLFKRYSTKDALFCASMMGDLEPKWIHLLDGKAGTGEVRSNLVTVLGAAIDFFRDGMPRMMMLWSAKSISPIDLMRSFEDPPPRRALAAIRGYLAAEAEGGRVACEDADAAARLLLGAAWQFVFFEMMGINPEPKPKAREFAERIVAMLWDGVTPEAP